MSSKSKAIFRWIWRIVYFSVYNTSTIVGLIYLFYGRGEATIDIVGKPITIDYALWDILRFWEKGLIVIFALIGIFATILTIMYIVKKWDRKKEIDYRAKKFSPIKFDIKDLEKIMED